MPEVSDIERELSLLAQIHALPHRFKEEGERLAKAGVEPWRAVDLEPEGQGHNASLLGAAGTLLRLGVEPQEIFSHLRSNYSHERPDSDIDRAIERAGDAEWNRDGAKDKLPTADHMRLMAFGRLSKEEIAAASPVPDAHKLSSSEVIRHLFDEDDLICVQASPFQKLPPIVRVGDLSVLGIPTALGEQMADNHFLNPATFKSAQPVPNPKERSKAHPDGKPATRCDANVVDRRYIVLEMDEEAGVDSPLVERFNGFNWEVRKHAPLVMVVYSGGKSLHFWYDTHHGAKGESADSKGRLASARRKEFLKIFALHGADKAPMQVLSQTCRMPNAEAQPGRRGQTLLYLDPERSLCADWGLPGLEDGVRMGAATESYYSKEKYWLRDHTGAWNQFSLSRFSSKLEGEGYRKARMEAESQSPMEIRLSEIEDNSAVDAVIRSASGRHAGYYEENGYRVLVTRSPRVLTPQRGRHEAWDALLNSMFGFDPVQLDILKGQLARGVRDFRNDGDRHSRWAPRQAIHIIGEPDAGKSFLAKFGLPLLFGQRWANAENMFKARPDLGNSAAFGSELIYLDDTKVLGTRFDDRQKYGEQLKEICVGLGSQQRQLFSDEVALRPWWMFFRFMNTTPKIIQTLPPLEEGLYDKMILLYAEAKLPENFDTGPHDWTDKLIDDLAAQAPAFLQHLLQWKTPKEIAHTRYPTIPFVQGRVRDLLNEVSPVQALLDIMREEWASLFPPESMLPDAGATATLPRRIEGGVRQIHEMIMRIPDRKGRVISDLCSSPVVLLGQLKQIRSEWKAGGADGGVRYSADDGLMRSSQINSGNPYWKINLEPREAGLSLL